MPTILNNGIQLPDKGSVDWYSSMQSNYNLIDTHLGNTDAHVTTEDKANWNSKQGSLSQAQLDAIAQVSTNTSDIASLQSDKANASHTHSSSDITDIGDYATKQYVDNSISGLVDSAPNALDTLNELAAALNDDANFASTVATALGAKANSADLATVATSGSYNDLNNKPSIPTKTSDLTNDSNFVDTSNSAVASGITSAKVTDYDAHIVDTDIHVTTADKNKWNNQTYVVRYASVAVSDNSTVPYSNLNNTDNVKANDLLLDINGKIYQISAVDTANETVSVTAPLTQLAVDSGVVHKTGNETITGKKIFSDDLTIYNNDSSQSTKNLVISSSKIQVGDTSNSDSFGINFNAGSSYVSRVTAFKDTSGTQNLQLGVRTKDGSNNLITSMVRLRLYANGFSSFESDGDNLVSLGSSSNKWKNVNTYQVNGLEPSSLSLPSGNASDVIDISGYITDLSGAVNLYTPPANGYLTFTFSSGSQVQIYPISGGGVSSKWASGSSAGIIRGFMPVLKNSVIRIVVNATTMDSFVFIPCQGNV